MSRLVRQCSLFLMALVVVGCSVGPEYQRPSVPVPADFKEGDLWRSAQPRDHEIRGDWWTAYDDTLLNTLEEQVTIANQSLAQAEAQYRQAQALVQGARANLFPTVGASLSAARSRSSATSGSAGGDTQNQFSLAVGAAWEPDVWGRIRRQIEANVAGAQATAADLQSLRLLLQAELAQDYFLLRITDAQKELLDETVAAYQKALVLTQNRYRAGVAAKTDVVQATAQLTATPAQAIDLGVQRAQLEHAIALLTGRTPAEFSLAYAPVVPALPQIPVGVPSLLLERRPDVASAERRMAAANAQIGVATAAYYPSFTVSASAGYQNSLFADVLSAPSFFWSLGPAALAQTLFDGGARKAQVEQARAGYDASVAAYRQTVLAGFQEAEDALASLSILEEEARVQNEAVIAARESVRLTTNQYKAGIVNFLNVIVVQAAALNSERTALSIQSQRLNASVLLIKALGGGWDSAELFK